MAPDSLEREERKGWQTASPEEYPKAHEKFEILCLDASDTSSERPIIVVVTKDLVKGQHLCISANEGETSWQITEEAIASPVKEVFIHDDGSIALETDGGTHLLLQPTFGSTSVQGDFLDELVAEAAKHATSNAPSVEEDSPFSKSPTELSREDPMLFEKYVDMAIARAQSLIEKTPEGELMKTDWSAFPELEWATRPNAPATKMIFINANGQEGRWNSKQRDDLMVVVTTRYSGKDTRTYVREKPSRLQQFFGNAMKKLLGGGKPLA